MRVAICPGSFDPITNGHLDIIRRAAKLFDHVVVAVLQNSSKKCVFSVEERVDMIRDCITDLDNVSASSFDGLLVEYAKKTGATAIVKGLRAVSDFDYEFQMALFNKEINAEVETIFLTTSPEHMYLSSSVVREMAAHGGDMSRFVPACVKERIIAKYRQGV